MAYARPELKPLFEKAAEDTTALPATAFADDLRQYPIHSPDDAVLSKLAAVDAAADGVTMARIDRALELYGFSPASLSSYATKQAQAQAEPPVHYLLPHEARIPVASVDQLKEAASALVRQSRHLKVAQIAQAAMTAVQLGGTYDLDSSALPATLYKFAGLTACDAGVLLDWVEARAAACPEGSEVRAQFDKLANVLEVNFPRTGLLNDRTQLVKIAGAIEELDEMAGLQGRYDRTLLSPLEAVFNTNKFASATTCHLGGQDIELAKIQALPDDVFDEYVGDGASAEKMQDDVCKAMIETLPADVQRSMLANLRSYLV